METQLTADGASAPDLEQTAELPVLDASAFGAAPAELGVTDTWVAPSAPTLRALQPDSGASLEQHRRLEDDLRTLAENLRELEDQLTHRGERLIELERELAEVRGARAAAEERAEASSRELTDARLALSTARAQCEELTQRLAAREAETRAVRERDRSLEGSLAARDRALQRAEQQLVEMRLQRTAQLEALQRREGRRGVLDTMFRALDGEVGRRDSQVDRLRGELAAERERAEALERELAAAHARIDGLTSEVRARTEAGAQAVSAAQERAQALDAVRAEHAEALRAAQEELGAQRERVVSAEADLRAAEDAINRLESEQRAERARIEELTRLNDDWRLTLESARQSLEERDALIRRLEAETAHSTALLDHIQHNVRFVDTASAGTPQSETAARLLIRADRDGEVVHVLGRKTSIGRTPDNDVQIDTKFVSRHHAVILAGPTQAIIEDLNSTNGVLVNGHKVMRQSLKDGDAIVVGKTRFQFAVRPPGERH